MTRRCATATQGDPAAADSLRQAIEERLKWASSVPQYRERVGVGGG